MKIKNICRHYSRYIKW